jgi:hypothetical protein
MPAVAVLRAVLAVVPAIARDPAQDSYRDLLIMAVPPRLPAEIPPGQPTRGGSVGRCSDNRGPPTVWRERSEQQVRETYSLKIRGGKYIPASVDSDLH